MKKICISFLIILIGLSFSGCDVKSDLNENLSEVTYYYFQAIKEGFVSSIRVGEREDPYIIDGKHGKNCGFSLISLKIDNQVQENFIVAELFINGIATKITLELNPANHNYMVDLGYQLNSNDKIILKYDNIELNYENISNNFKITYKNAIKIAKENYNDYIQTLYKGKKFKGECYLKVLTLKNAGQDELFWIFTIVNENYQHKNIVINIENGNVLIKD